MMASTQTVRDARAGIREAQDALFRACWPIAWSTAYSITGSSSLAEDAAQAAVLSIFGSLDRFDERRPLEPWLRRIAANAALTELRKQKRQPRPDPDPGLYRDAATSPESGTVDGLLEEVGLLPEERRLVIVLYYWLDYSIGDIADLLGVPQGTVASRRSRALNQLRLRMEDRRHART